MYLLDTNIFLEVLLEQNKYQIVNKFLKEVTTDDAYQYLIAKTYSLILVTFDNDFNKTDIKKHELK